jgi:hypothetical protein
MNSGSTTNISPLPMTFAALDKPLEQKISIPVPHKGITSNLISPLKTRSQSGIKARVLQLNPHFVQ